MSQVQGRSKKYGALIGVYSALLWASFAWAGAAKFDVFQGKVSFEPRTTLIKLAFCEGAQACVDSQNYWALVVTGANNHVYELNQRFSEGGQNPPAAVEINTLTVRPGSVVRVKAHLDPVTPDYSRILEVLKLQVRMDW